MKSIRVIFFSLLVSFLSSQMFAEDVPKTVNINTADAVTLSMVLSGVGDKKAEAIVAYRKANGLFKSAQELISVKGIGEALFEKNKSRIEIIDG